jgi:tRNA threonylcarbamoyladenosine biosynthesis protein TsaE
VQWTEVETISRSASETERAAGALADHLRPGDVVLVEGEVGTGKTTFVRAACRALGVRDNVASPSFTIGRSYRGRLPVSHLDLFRLDTLAGEDPALLADYLDPQAIAFVEWPEAARDELEQGRVALEIRLTHGGGDLRGIQLAGRPELVNGMERLLRGDDQR